MSLFSPSPQTSTASGTSSTSYNPSNNVINQWQGPTGLLATAGGLSNYLVNNSMYGGQMVASQDPLTQQYQNEAGMYGQYAPSTTQQSQLLGGTISDNMYNTQVNPGSISLPGYNTGSFQPGQLNLPQFGNIPSVSAPSGLSTTMYNPSQVQAPSSYTPQQVQAAMVSAPGAVNNINGIASVQAPNLNNYQMGSYQNVNAPSLQGYSMSAAPNVTSGQTTTPQSWTDPGTAAQYMSPYTQQVVNAQLAQAQVQEGQQIAGQQSQAAQAGAFGGSREAVEEANTSIGYQQLAAQLQAQGLQSAYTSGQQQFNTQQQAQQQAQQFNVQSGLQASLANQQAQQQANTQNLASQLQTQQLGAQTGLQSQLANQQAGLTTNQANLQSQLQTQQLGATTGLQAALANQSMGYQTQLANQQAQEFGYGQQLQAQLANQSAGLTAQQLNQSAGLQSALASMGYQYGASTTNAANALQSGLQNQQLMAQLGMFGAGQQLTAAQGNQAAQMQGLGMTYQGGLSGALQTQNLGMSGAEYGGQLGLQSAAQGYGLQQSQQGLNMQALMNQGQLQQASANTAEQGYQGQLAGLGALGSAAGSAQSYDQSVADAQYQNWQNSISLPMQAEGYLANLTAMQPVPYTTNSAYQGTSTVMPSQPSILQSAITGGIGAAGALGNLGWAPLAARKGGRVPSGLAVVKRSAAGAAGLGRTRLRRYGDTHGLARAA